MNASVTAQTSDTPFRARMLQWTLSLLAISLLFLTMQRYGAGLQWDSVGYVTAARQLLGQAPFAMVYHVPVYPLLLALTSLLAATDPAAAAHWLNLFLTVCLVGISAPLLASAGFRVTLLSSFALAGVFVVSQPLFFISQYALSELAFITLVMIYLHVLVSFDSAPTMKLAIALALLAAIVSLTRYVGIILLPMGMLVLWDKRKDIPRAQLLKMMIVYALVGTLPLALWFLKNVLLYDTISGERKLSPFGVIENIELTLRVMGGWFIPRFRFKEIPWLAPLVGTLVPAFAGMIAFWLRRSWRTRLPYFLILFFLFHTTAIITVSSLVWIDPISDRLLAPSAVPLGLLIAYDIALLPAALKRKAPSYVTTIFLALFLFSWLGPSAVWVGGQVARGMDRGVIGYQSAEWQDRPTLQFVIKHEEDLPRDVFTNEWPAIRLHTRLSVLWMPSLSDEKVLNHLGPSKSTLVLFQNGDQWSDPVERTWLQGFEILREDSLADGHVLIVQRRSHAN